MKRMFRYVRLLNKSGPVSTLCGCRRFLHLKNLDCTNKGLMEALEPLFKNGLTNCTGQENRVLIEEIALQHGVSPDKVKGWIYRRRAKEQKKSLGVEKIAVEVNEYQLTEKEETEANNVKSEKVEVIKKRGRPKKEPSNTYLHPVDLEPVDDSPIPTPQQITPLILERWEHYLKNCDLPDKQYVLNGIMNGFSLEANPRILRSAKRNLASAEDNPDAVTEYLKQEIATGTMSGPYVRLPYINAHISRIGLKQKKDSTSKWRLITDLSYPPGACINDSIAEEDYLVQYVGIKAAIEKVRRLGRSCLLSKFDLANAYRLLAIPPHERYQLVYCWNDQYYVDLALPFGARSSPRIFTRFSDVLEWILMKHGPVADMQHMLDDFLICGAAGTSEASDALERSFEICEELGVAIQHKKTVLPTTKMRFLGLDFDTEAMEVRVPEDLVNRVQISLLEALSKKSVTKRELFSVVGMLYCCSQCIPHGGAETLERLHHSALSVAALHHKVMLSPDDFDDLEWWMDRLDGWNGRCLINDMDNTGDYTKFFS